MTKRKDNELFTFRRYKKQEGKQSNKARHPKLIVDKNNTEYGFMGLTSSPKRGYHSNIKLEKNPKKNDIRQAYIRKEIRYDSKNKFGQILNEYNLSNKDKKFIIDYVNKHKKR